MNKDKIDPKGLFQKILYAMNGMWPLIQYSESEIGTGIQQSITRTTTITSLTSTLYPIRQGGLLLGKYESSLSTFNRYIDHNGKTIDSNEDKLFHDGKVYVRAVDTVSAKKLFDFLPGEITIITGLSSVGTKYQLYFSHYLNWIIASVYFHSPDFTHITALMGFTNDEGQFGSVSIEDAFKNYKSWNPPNITPQGTDFNRSETVKKATSPPSKSQVRMNHQSTDKAISKNLDSDINPLNSRKKGPDKNFENEKEDINTPLSSPIDLGDSNGKNSPYYELNKEVAIGGIKVNAAKKKDKNISNDNQADKVVNNSDVPACPEDLTHISGRIKIKHIWDLDKKIEQMISEAGGLDSGIKQIRDQIMLTERALFKMRIEMQKLIKSKAFLAEYRASINRKKIYC